MIKMKFELIPLHKKNELAYYEFKIKEFLILTKSLKAKNLQIPVWLINQGLYYSKTVRRLKNETCIKSSF